jgi:hypothetical protein
LCFFHKNEKYKFQKLIIGCDNSKEFNVVSIFKNCFVLNL